MTTPTEPAKPPRRKFLRLSLRALMLFVLILAGVLGWIVHRAQVQRDAITAIEKTGGKVQYDWQWPPSPTGPKAGPSGPKWLVDWLGVDYFSNVTMVQLGPKATDADMEHVGRLSKLENFWTSGARGITDAGAAQLEGLRELNSVSLSGMSVTGKTLAYLRDKSKLTNLTLMDVPIEGADLVHLEALTNLERLGLSGTKIQGSGLIHLRNKSKLKSITLNNLPIRDDDLAHLEGLTTLDVLDLSGTKVTDEGLARLERLVNLRELRLNQTSITGTGFSHLKGMSRLLWLRLNQSKVRDFSTLPSLPTLWGLILEDTPVDDASLAGLPDLPAFRYVYLAKTNVTDEGLSHLLRYRKTLKAIGLGGPKMTDASAATLAKLDQTESLLLKDTKMTDATLDQLTGLKKLKSLDLQRNGTTEAGFTRLQKALPQLKTAKELMASQLALNKARAEAAARKTSTNPGTKP